MLHTLVCYKLSLRAMADGADAEIATFLTEASRQ